MENAEQILVVFLSTALAVFLFLAIIATIKIIKILNHLKSISAKAEKIANTAETVGEFIKYTAGPVAIGKFFSNINEAVHRHSKKTKAGDS